MTPVYALTLALLGVAAALALYRAARGPSMLDRAVSLDVMTSLAMCGVGTFAVVRDDYSDLPILLVLSLLGFVGSVSLARFFAGRSPRGPR
ncbi:monovalent cation/H+ antiporter complex subunit F [Nonomuraea sp. NPDC050783]|uniref:monovalent cation/H+ antiporter complex subunit F n=1 Tax=Nonomuraea sp. NPDC050783 TaxID=3154634 RepID=UPI0034650F03